MRYLGAGEEMIRAYFPGYQEEEDITPPPPTKPRVSSLTPAEQALLTKIGGGTMFPPDVDYSASRPVWTETYNTEAAERAADEQRLSAELGMKTASQQASILSKPSANRSTPVGITSLSAAEQIAGALIGGWASVAQQKELARQLYRQKTAYVSPTTAQKAAAFRWDYVGYAVLGFAVLGAAVYFMSKKRGSAAAAPAIAPMLALPAPVMAKNRGRRRR